MNKLLLFSGSAAWRRFVSQTNLFTDPSAFDTASWTKFDCTISANSTIAPNGKPEADKVIVDSGASKNPQVSQSVAVTSGVTYSVGWFVKAGGYNFAMLQLAATIAAGTSANRQAYFNLATGALGTIGTTWVNPAIYPLPNSWFFVTADFVASASASGNIYLRPTETNAVATFTGDGASGLYAWTGQVYAK